jgi:UDP-N-acetylglucosamine diphosphorylase/glucosamine-1-phosphate N-acetyltransferase
MAAGEGKRMRSTIPKVLHLFKKIPMLVRIIKTAKELNPKKIIIITGKHDTIIKSTLSEYLNISTFIFVNQSIPLGTGDAIKCCLPFYEPGENILILNGDIPLIDKFILNGLIKNNKYHSMSVLVARLNDPKGYGRIIYEKSIFVGIIEEKDCNENQKMIQTVNTGIYLIDSELLHLYIPMIQNNNSQQEYYLTDIVSIIKKYTEVEINTYIVDPFFTPCVMGINTPEELAILENFVKT